jgi:MoaA/NifB/PqqE/SkfB family radical SAM enzyme
MGNLLRRRPYVVSFEITHRCNIKCKHCHLGGNIEEEQAPAEAYARVAREVRPVVALVSGGEPLLRRDAEGIVAAIKKDNAIPYVAMTTNAVLLNPDRYRSLRRAGVDRFSISLDYPDERHDEFRGFKGLFGRIERLMGELDRLGDKAVNISAVVHRHNFRDLAGIAELGRRWGVGVNFSTYTWLRTDDMDYVISSGELPEFRRIVDELIDLKRENRNIRTPDFIFRNMVRFFETGGVPGCRAGERFFVVNADATLSPCGLIMRQYRSVEELRREFTSTNTCSACYTSLRADCESPPLQVIRDNLRVLG